MKNRNFKKLVWQWFEKGNHDIEDAGKLCKNGGHSDTICFHCHQAVEKYLKGYLIFNNVGPRKIHDLVILLEECHQISNFSRKEKLLISLPR
ncbi:HEPN domain-containing protein [Patescibacteria group bacterium]|nr:HEPN domain-containing protein [Patescibacteria group bacterium]